MRKLPRDLQGFSGSSLEATDHFSLDLPVFGSSNPYPYAPCMVYSPIFG